MRHSDQHLAYGNGWAAHFFDLVWRIVFFFSPIAGLWRHRQHLAGDVISSGVWQGSVASCVSLAHFSSHASGARFTDERHRLGGLRCYFLEATTTQCAFLLDASSSCIRCRGRRYCGWCPIGSRGRHGLVCASGGFARGTASIAHLIAALAVLAHDGPGPFRIASHCLCEVAFQATLGPISQLSRQHCDRAGRFALARK